MTDTKTSNTSCLVCEKDDKQVPLIQFMYQGETLWICSQHLPILIHKPDQLASVLPGAENLEEAEHHD